MSVSSRTVITHSPEETQQLAADLAKSLTAGQSIALNGQLGAGKTQFVRGLAIGLGINPRAVSSPTYVLLNVYPGGRLTLYHLDAYRLSGPDDFDAIGFSELLEQNGIVVVEWAERVAALLPQNCLQISIESLGETDRQITIVLK